MITLTSRLKKLTQKLTAGTNPSVLGIDISPSSIRIIQLKREKGQAILETYGEIALGPYGGKGVGEAINLPPERIAEALRDVMSEAKVTTTNAGLSIPFSASLISVIEVPTTDEDKLKTIIPLEARKYIPVPVTEVYLDWHILPATEIATPGDSGEPATRPVTEALLVAIHKETIAKYQAIVDKSALDASFFEIEIFSTIRAVLDRVVKPVMILDLGYSSTKLYMVDHGVLRSSHIINHGTKEMTQALSASLGISMSEAEALKRHTGVHDATSEMASASASAALRYLFSEAERTIVEYERNRHQTIDRVMLTGSGAILPGVLDQAREHLDVEVEIANPFKKVEAPAFLGDVLQNVGPEFAVAIGVALRRLEEL